MQSTVYMSTWTKNRKIGGLCNKNNKHVFAIWGMGGGEINTSQKKLKSIIDRYCANNSR